MGRRRCRSGDERLKSGENMSRQYRLEVLECGASNIRVLSRERPGRNPHWLPLQCEREKVEDMLPDAVRLAAGFQFSLDKRQKTREGPQKFRVFISECKESATATQAYFKIAEIESSQKAVARDFRRTRLERKRQTAPYRVTRTRIVQRRDHFACPARPKRGERRHDLAEHAVFCQEWYERAEDERI